MTMVFYPEDRRRETIARVLAPHHANRLGAARLRRFRRARQAQTRNFFCGHGRAVTIVVNNPRSITVSPIDGAAMTLRQQGRNPFHFVRDDYGVTISPDQNTATVDIPDFGVSTCRLPGGPLDRRPAGPRSCRPLRPRLPPNAGDRRLRVERRHAAADPRQPTRLADAGRVARRRCACGADERRPRSPVCAKARPS